MVFLSLFYKEIREYFKACRSLAALLFYVFAEPAINNKLPKPGITLLPSEDIHRKSSLFTFLMSAKATSSNVVLGRYLELIRLINVLHCLLKVRLITGMDCFGIRLIA